LALYAGRKAVEEKGWFPGGTLFIDFHGYGVDGLTTDQALLALLEGLGVPGADVPGTTSHRYTRYQQLLAGRRPMLLFFDNVSSGTRLAHLLPGTGHHRVLITSRYRFTNLDARLISLDSLRPEDAVRLVDKSLRISDERDDRCAQEERAVTRLAALCDRHPLALHIAVSLLRKNRYRPIAALANELQDTADRTKKLGLRPILDTAYGQLKPDEARLFRLMSLAPRAEVSTDAAVALADRVVDRTEGLLAELTSSHLVIPVPVNATVQWRLHDMVRQYGARTVADSVSLREEAEAARERLLTYYRQRASEAESMLRKISGRNDQTDFTSRAEALAWLDAEWPSLMASIQWCRIRQHAHGAIRLALELMDHSLNRRWSFDDWITAVRPACEAADRLGDPIVMARLWNSLGSALRQTGQPNTAMDAHTRALALYQSDSYRQGEAKALYNIGVTLLDLGQVEEAIANLTKARDLHAAVENRRGEAMTLNGLGSAERMAQRLAKAIAAYTRASELYSAADDLLGQASAWSNIGSVLQEAMKEDEALVAYGTAARMYRELEEWHRAGLVWQWIARIHDTADDRPQARAHYLKAAEAFTFAGDHDRATECRIYADVLT
jgi:tetratricopeptide (TPR) repeat protein